MPCTIIEHKIGSFKALTLSDGEFSLTLLPEKGSDIISLRHEKTDTEFLWTSPNGLQTDAPTKSFIDNYEGGWQECFPTGGPPIKYRGAEIGQHGEVHALRWEVVETVATDTEVSVTLEVRTLKTPFFLRKKITLRGATGIIEIDETATNESNEDLPVLWGQHPALGGNFLDEHCKIDTLAGRVWSYVLPENAEMGQFDQNVEGVWPMLKNKHGDMVDVSEIPAPSTRTADMLFIGDFKDGWISVTNRERKVGIAFLFDPEMHKVMWLWQMFGGGTGYPWYGRAYTMALEPFTGAPDPHAGDIARVAGTHTIAAGATATARLRVLLYKGIRGVGRITADGTIVPRI